MDITISNELDDPLPTDWLVDLAETAMRAEDLPESTQLSITLVAESRMSQLNREYMGKQGATDVLSFPIEDFSSEIEDRGDDGPPLMLGDIVICPPVVGRNAAAAEVAFDDELALMVVHGTLHLLGRDHELDEEAEAMEQREREILALVGRTRP